MSKGLVWRSNGEPGSDIRLIFDQDSGIMPDRSNHTIIWEAYYRPQSNYYAWAWHAYYDGSWHSGDWEYGTHPYPATIGTWNPVTGNVSGGTGTSHYHEIAGLGGGDFISTPDPGGVGNPYLAVVKQTPLIQARKAEDIGGGVTRHTFYPDLVGHPTLTIVQDFSITGTPSDPAFYFGPSDWASSGTTTTEASSGRYRRLKIFNAALSDADIATEANSNSNSAQTSAGIASVLYINVDPQVGDYADKSGVGTTPFFDQTVLPFDYDSTLPFKDYAIGSNSVTLPAFAVGDVAIFAAFRNGNATAPSLPSGWTQIQSGGANTCSMLVAYRILQSGDTTTGTITNANETILALYDGTQLDATTPIGASVQNGGSGTTLTYSALSGMTKTDGTSTILAFSGHRSTNTNQYVAPSGLRFLSGHTDLRTAAFDSKTGKASWSSTNASVSGSSSGWRTVVVELVKGSASTTISCSTGNAVADGTSATVYKGVDIGATAGNAVANGTTATVYQGVDIQATAGNAVANGVSASVYIATTISCGTGNAVAAGTSAAVYAGVDIGTTAGNAVADGTAASVYQGLVVSATAGNAVAAGVDASITVAGTTIINCGTGNAVADSSQAGVYQGTDIQATAGNAVADGVLATVSNYVSINCTPSNAVCDGVGATVYQGSYVGASPGNAVCDGVQALIEGGQIVVKIGGDDVPGKHTGWNRKAWKKRQELESRLEETIRQAYRKTMGIEPEPREVQRVLEKAVESTPIERISWGEEAETARFMSEQIQTISRLLEEERERDDEEAIILLL